MHYKWLHVAVSLSFGWDFDVKRAVYAASPGTWNHKRGSCESYYKIIHGIQAIQLRASISLTVREEVKDMGQPALSLRARFVRARL